MTKTMCCGISNPTSGLNPQGNISRIIPNTRIKLLNKDGVKINTLNIRGEVFVRGRRLV